MKKLYVFILVALLGLNAFAQAEEIIELDPHAENIEQQLLDMDALHLEETGELPYVYEETSILMSNSCYQKSCPIWLDVSKAEQKAYLYHNGELVGEYLVSSGTGNRTPNFDQHPQAYYDKNGRPFMRAHIGRYSSSKYPGGNYITPDGRRMGNMPYAVFIQGGFAVHGTPQGNWRRLGSKASHGCIRMHPENALIFNRLARQYGRTGVWITVRN